MEPYDSYGTPYEPMEPPTIPPLGGHRGFIGGSDSYGTPYDSSAAGVQGAGAEILKLTAAPGRLSTWGWGFGGAFSKRYDLNFEYI